MVLNHHLRHGDGMTLITVQDGKIVLRDGQVGTEQACCCEQEDDCNDPSIPSRNPSPGCCGEIIDLLENGECPGGWESNLFDGKCHRVRCIDRCCDCGKGPFPTHFVGSGCTPCEDFTQFTECGECPQCDEAP